VHVPGVSSVIVAPCGPLAVQTLGVVVVNVTGRPEVAEAFAVSGDCPVEASVSASKVMV
jgi:hypothetical protein